MSITDKVFFEEYEKEVEAEAEFNTIFNKLNAELILQQIEYYKAQTELAKAQTELINIRIAKYKK